MRATSGWLYRLASHISEAFRKRSLFEMGQTVSQETLTLNRNFRRVAARLTVKDMLEGSCILLITMFAFSANIVGRWHNMWRSQKEILECYPCPCIRTRYLSSCLTPGIIHPSAPYNAASFRMVYLLLLTRVMPC